MTLMVRKLRTDHLRLMGLDFLRVGINGWLIQILVKVAVAMDGRMMLAMCGYPLGKEDVRMVVHIGMFKRLEVITEILNHGRNHEKYSNY